MSTPLNELMSCFEYADGPLCAAQLAQRMGKPTEVVEGMLATLVALGKLTALVENEACRWCPLRAGCEALPAEKRRYYRPPTRATEQGAPIDAPDPHIYLERQRPEGG